VVVSTTCIFLSGLQFKYWRVIRLLRCCLLFWRIGFLLEQFLLALAEIFLKLVLGVTSLDTAEIELGFASARKRLLKWIGNATVKVFLDGLILLFGGRSSQVLGGEGPSGATSGDKGVGLRGGALVKAGRLRLIPDLIEGVGLDAEEA